MDELTSAFIEESREQLADMEAGLLDLERQPGDVSNLGAIFRAAHTIKGASGVVECEYVENFTHQVESVLDRLRDGRLGVSQALVTLLLRCVDHMNKLVQAFAEGLPTPAEALLAAGKELTAQLIGYDQDLSARGADAETRAVEKSGGGLVATDYWHISVRFNPGVLKNGMDPLSFLRYLVTLGDITGIETLDDAMPAGEEMDAECCYLGFEIRFQSRATKSEIEAVFAFVQDDCSLRILPPDSLVAEFVELINSLPEDSMRLGEILVRIGALTQAELDASLAQQAEAPCAAADQSSALPRIGEVLVEQGLVQPEVVDAAVERQAQVSQKKAAESRMLRVHADKLDSLIAMVGELVIAGASAQLLARGHGGEMLEATSILSRLVENIRDSALQLRMVQIGETFSRFHRVVRDVSKELGKDIELVVRGGDTELDKSLVEKLGDPLMHLVRNGLDHGIEPADVRRARGKPARGTLSLDARHDSGNVVIQVRDDGGGLNRERIRAKALERGLIQPAQTLTDQEIVNLIFEAGFSTAHSVSNLSGRGVGMDVVKRNIQALRGTVEVASEEGEGCTFTIRLPLTLAIIDGFLVEVGRASYVIPLEAVVECMELRDVSARRDYLNLRGEVLPFIRLRHVFGIEEPVSARESVVVIQFAGQRAGLVVDRLMGEFQTVIKPLGGIFRRLKGIAGSTILGSGEVALILDVQSLVHICSEKQNGSPQDAARAYCAPQLS
ncbi:MAG: chemotaxis protein CheA [Rhodocyclaceae bacterium]|nr:chemotaxis protein CheA [Rhodocyclaceae bacterium]